MPITLDKAPKVLPKSAQALWVDMFNGVLENCEGATAAECDERAAKSPGAKLRGNTAK